MDTFIRGRIYAFWTVWGFRVQTSPCYHLQYYDTSSVRPADTDTSFVRPTDIDTSLFVEKILIPSLLFQQSWLLSFVPEWLWMRGATVLNNQIRKSVLNNRKKS